MIGGRRGFGSGRACAVCCCCCCCWYKELEAGRAGWMQIGSLWGGVYVWSETKIITVRLVTMSLALPLSWAWCFLLLFLICPFFSSAFFSPCPSLYFFPLCSYLQFLVIPVPVAALHISAYCQKDTLQFKKKKISGLLDRVMVRLEQIILDAHAVTPFDILVASEWKIPQVKEGSRL